MPSVRQLGVSSGRSSTLTWAGKISGGDEAHAIFPSDQKNSPGETEKKKSGFILRGRSQKRMKGSASVKESSHHITKERVIELAPKGIVVRLNFRSPKNKIPRRSGSPRSPKSLRSLNADKQIGSGWTGTHLHEVPAGDRTEHVQSRRSWSRSPRRSSLFTSSLKIIYATVTVTVT